jgi:hypothetical protein
MCVKICQNPPPVKKVHAMLHRYIVTRYIPKPHIIYWCISLNARYLKFICLHCRTVKSYSKVNHTTRCLLPFLPPSHPLPPPVAVLQKLYITYLISKGTHELRSYNSSPTVHCNFHITNFTVNFL